MKQDHLITVLFCFIIKQNYKIVMAKTVLNLLLTFDGFIAGEQDEIDWIDKVHKRK
jgi:hypothetical protein